MIHSQDSINKKVELINSLERELNHIKFYLTNLLPDNRQKTKSLDKLTECLVWARQSIEHAKENTHE